jgi:hypothetical protein
MEKGNDGEKFTILIQAMAATFRADVTPALLEGYWMGLEDLAIERIEAAVRRGIRECEFMPAAYKLREMVSGGPDYYQPAERQLEQIETCAFHTTRECVGKAPQFVPWCRKCKRLARLASWPKRLLLVPPEDEAS